MFQGFYDWLEWVLRGNNLIKMGNEGKTIIDSAFAALGF